MVTGIHSFPGQNHVLPYCSTAGPPPQGPESRSSTFRHLPGSKTGSLRSFPRLPVVFSIRYCYRLIQNAPNISLILSLSPLILVNSHLIQFITFFSSFPHKLHRPIPKSGQKRREPKGKTLDSRAIFSGMLCLFWTRHCHGV